MNKLMRAGSMFTAMVLVSGFVLASPSFKFGKDAAKNGMMGSSDVISIVAYPKFPLLARNITAKSATLIYKGNDAHAPFEFYEQALIKDGWKSADAMMGKTDTMGKTEAGKDGAMMDGKTDTMAKTDGAMMGKTDAMAKSDDAMMMAKHSATKLSFKSYTITLDAKLVGDRITVELELK